MKKTILSLMYILAAFSLFFTHFSSISYASSEGSDSRSVLPLTRAHAHNDYEHTRPLLDALDHGFTSVEADVWLVDGELLVAHDKIDVRPGRTLKSLYLDPLKDTIKQNGGSVYQSYKHDFILWVDIKSEGEATYKVLHEQLKDYQSMLTRFTPSTVNPGSITVIVSGNRPRALMEEQSVRYAAYDGRMSDLGSNTSQQFMPVISDNWQKHFTWMGTGEMPEAERQKLNNIVSTAHANGQKVRFWATPDLPLPNRETIWKELLNAGVDLINSDDLTGLQKFLIEHDSQPSEPYVTWRTKNN